MENDQKIRWSIFGTAFDPQVVDIKGSIATRLPARYKENKLGHNWSISWVADEISKR